ncbi:MAG: MBL fold metallo-hydrolase [Deltaproteobacteria bacterium]|nr:MBL fold metallo-hydrolase [Candidatus Anaeroferrophillacea bacterium]
MKLTIVYDNDIFDRSPGIPDHGFSCLVENGDAVVLFDTGAGGAILTKNMARLGIDPTRITAVVISHEHYDHHGGLPALLPALTDPLIYRLEPGRYERQDVREIIVRAPMTIFPGIHSTGRLPGQPLDEQSLLLETDTGIVVLTGCSHPGVATILRAAAKRGKLIGLIGGLHGFADLELLAPLARIHPCHCTVYKQEIRRRFPETAGGCGVGMELRL